ncbi:MAG: hypothetical protein NZ740_08550, partial [Kiritimatiellae bacterium]|nr:hypothetical protein [Kiritimatiellia bacterium]MDW8459143.1 hypothetical protein [Verrucomicrobiota bacterium]
QGTGDGASYEWLDSSAGDGELFYWLEDVSWSFRSEYHGPFAVEEVKEEEDSETVLARFEVDAVSAGLYRISANSLAKSGLGQIDANRLAIKVGTNEAALLLIPSEETLQPGDSILFFLPETSEERTTAEIVLKENPKRMGWAYAAPQPDGALWTGVVRTDGTLPFEVTADWQRYLLMGFNKSGTIVLDISDPWAPLVLFDYASLEIPGQLGIYLSYFVEHSADCLAIQVDAIREISEIRAP